MAFFFHLTLFCGVLLCVEKGNYSYTILAVHRSTHGSGDIENLQGLRFEHKNSRVKFLPISLPSAEIQLLATVHWHPVKTKGLLIESSVRTEFGSALNQKS